MVGHRYDVAVVLDYHHRIAVVAKALQGTLHDDLPAMDNDDLRRGNPTCHIAFDEATAILAGDGLLTYAFEVAAQSATDPAKTAKGIEILASMAGPSGMVLGQIYDMNWMKRLL